MAEGAGGGSGGAAGAVGDAARGLCASVVAVDVISSFAGLAFLDRGLGVAGDAVGVGAGGCNTGKSVGGEYGVGAEGALGAEGGGAGDAVGAVGGPAGGAGGALHIKIWAFGSAGGCREGRAGGT